MKTLISKDQADVKKRILEISHAQHFSHLGSCFSAAELIHGVYKVKKKKDRFVLSNGHAGISLYAVLEKYKLLTREQVLSFHLHPDRNPNHFIDCSSGSLGQGLPIAVGMALATPKQKVYCMISDGESAEGSIWESLRIIADNNIHNIIILVNANGYCAYEKVSLTKLYNRIKAFGIPTQKVDGTNEKKIEKAIRSAAKSQSSRVLFCKTSVAQFSFLKEINAHYLVMTDDQFAQAMKSLENMSTEKKRRKK